MAANRLRLWLTFLLVVGLVSGAVWDANTYPNPTTQTGAKQCGLRSAGQLCDPDGILSEAERYRINHDLSKLESKTYQEFGRNFCEKKGLTAVIGLAKNVKGGQEADVRKMATDLRQRWGLDQQCMKGLVIIVSTEDRKFWVSRDSKVPVYAGEFSEILNAQTPLFREKKYQQALLNIIEQTASKTLSKQGQLQPAPMDDGRGPPGRKEPTPSGGGGMPFSFPKIPLWVILVILLVVIPTLICCCCFYYCCIRSKNGSTRRQGPSDEDPEARAAGQGGGGAGGTLRNLLSGAGGGAIMSMIQNCFRGSSGRGHQPAPPPDNRGGYVPPRPQAEEGKGLYPSAEVKDEGAGGGW